MNRCNVVKLAAVVFGVVVAVAIFPAAAASRQPPAVKPEPEKTVPRESAEPRWFRIPGHIVISFAFDRGMQRIVTGEAGFKEKENEPDELRQDVTRGHLTLWNAVTGEEITRFPGDFPVPLAVAFLPDGKTILAASRGWNSKSGVELALWNVETRQPVRTLVAANRSSLRMACSSDGGLVASRNFDQTVRVWDTANGKELAVLQHADVPPNLPNDSKAPVYMLLFSRDGKTLIVGCNRGTVDVWDVATWEKRAAFDEKSFEIRGIDVSPDGKSLAVVGIPIGLDGKPQLVGNGGLVRLRQIGGDQQRATWQVETNPTDAAFSPDGKLLAVAGFESSTIWNVESQEQIAVMRRSAQWNADRIRFSPDGKWIAIGGFTGLSLWDPGALGIAGGSGE